MILKIISLSTFNFYAFIISNNEINNNLKLIKLTCGNFVENI